MAVTEQKQAIVAQMKDTLSEAKGAVLVGYSGLTVAQATDLRRRFLAEGVEYKVIKNTLTRIAANELGLDSAMLKSEYGKNILAGDLGPEDEGLLSFPGTLRLWP